MSNVVRCSLRPHLRSPLGRRPRHSWFSSSTTSPTPSSRSAVKTVAVISASLTVGYVVGRLSAPQQQQQHLNNRVLPSGLPRTCCEHNNNNTTNERDDHESSSSAAAWTAAQRDLPTKLANIVGSDNVFNGQEETTRTSPFLKGARLGGGGKALAIVTPHSLTEVVQCVQVIIDADCVILPQGANTGLTGGSVPRVDTNQQQKQRPVVIMSMKYLDTIFPIDNGKRVVCLAGAGLATLSRTIPEWFPNRESHSILGSTFLNPTTAAGIALGSGGTQLRKGSAYTDRAMYITVSRNKWGENVVKVINTLGIAGIEDEDFPNITGKAIGNAVKQLDMYQQDVQSGFQRAMAKSSTSIHGQAKASDVGYAERLCQFTNDVSRYNADTRGCDCNRSEGKVLILATVHDTFPRPEVTKTFWISFDSLETALAFRKEVCLDNPQDLPISMEYMDRDSFDVIDRSGRVLANVIKQVGTSSSIVKTLWNIKLWIEALPLEGAPLWCDRMLHAINPWIPAVLPKRIMETGKSMDHHVAMTVGEFGTGTMDRLLDRVQTFASQNGRDKILIHECQGPSEAASLTAFRFVAAPAFRTWCVGEGVQGFSVDYALPKNSGATPPQLASSSTAKPLKRMRYSHFGCNVLHEDLAFDLDVDAMEAKMELKKAVEHQCGGKLPAEHGHGTEYHAPPETQERWKRIDPLNVMNPGVGGLSNNYKYQ